MITVVSDTLIIFNHMFTVPSFLKTNTIFNREDRNAVVVVHGRNRISKSKWINCPAPIISFNVFGFNSTFVKVTVRSFTSRNLITR